MAAPHDGQTHESHGECSAGSEYEGFHGISGVNIRSFRVPVGTGHGECLYDGSSFLDRNDVPPAIPCPCVGVEDYRTSSVQRLLVGRITRELD
jgi:hypothetical protein